MEFDYYSRSSLAAVVYGMVRARRRQTTAEKVVGVLTAQSRPRRENMATSERLKAFSSSMRRHVTPSENQSGGQQQSLSHISVSPSFAKLRCIEANNRAQRPITTICTIPVSRSTNDVPNTMGNIQEHFADDRNDNNGTIHPPF